MPAFVFNENLRKGRALRNHLDNFQSGLQGLQAELADMQQMTNEQIANMYGTVAVPAGNTDVQQATGMRDEIASALDKLNTIFTGSTTVLMAINQMLAKTG